MNRVSQRRGCLIRRAEQLRWLMANNDKTEIAIIVDRSGSMESIRKDMKGGFEAFVGGQRRLPGECVLSLYQFDGEYEVVYENKALRDVGSLQLQPRGSTALLDAVGKTIAKVAERHDALAEDARPAAVIVLVITDGHENASTEWSLDGVRKAVASAEQERDWRFVFLGADASTFDDAQRMGIGTAAQYEPDGDGVRAAYDALYSATSAYRGSVRSGVRHAKLSIERDLTKKKRGSGGASGST